MTSDIQPPVVPSGIVALPASRSQAIIRASVGVVAIVLGILCQVAGQGFPYNAPVEMIDNFLITVSLIGAGVVLLIFALLAALRPSSPSVVGRFSPLVLTGAILIAVTLVAWLISAPPSYFGHLADGSRQRYMELVGGLALAGAPWGAGLVFSTLGLRAWTRSSRIVGSIAIAIGLLLAVPAIYAAAIYSAGLTD